MPLSRETDTSSLGRRLLVSTAINVAILFAQLVGGVLAGSLALIADALHNLSDVVSLSVSYGANRIAQRPASERYTFAFKRIEVLAAVVNAASLIAVSLYIGFEAIQRLSNPQPVAGGLVIIFAAFGMVANAIAAWLLRGHGSNLNVRSAVLHLVSDSVASLGVLLAGVLIRFLGWYFVDPVVSLVLAVWMLRESVVLVNRAVQILMQGVPENIELKRVEFVILQVEGIAGVHDLHVWALTPEDIVLSAHVSLEGAMPSSLVAQTLGDIKERLRDEFGIGHATLEVDYGSKCAGLTCED
ncbi:MAG: cation diffusion facilitator family transporter [Coriobacteriia bacterium]